MGRQLSDVVVLAHIKVLHAEVKRAYGWPRMAKALVVTTDSKHALPVAENLLYRDFTPQTPS